MESVTIGKVDTKKYPIPDEPDIVASYFAKQPKSNPPENGTFIGNITFRHNNTKGTEEAYGMWTVFQVRRISNKSITVGKNQILMGPGTDQHCLR